MMERITEYHNGVPTIPHSKLVDACWKLADLEDLEEQNRLFALPVAIGGSVYEVVTDDRFEPYIEEYEARGTSRTLLEIWQNTSHQIMQGSFSSISRMRVMERGI